MGLSQCVEGLFHSIAQSPSSVYGVLVTFGHQSVLLCIQFKGVKVYFNSWLHGSAPHGAEGIVEGRDFHCGQHKQEKSDPGTPQVFSPPTFFGPSGLPQFR